MIKLFKDLNLSPNIQQALDKLGFTTPTEIQQKAIPLLLDENLDFHGQAQTGTGKTLAFGIPLIQRIDYSRNRVQGLIVAPTRELVLQICDSLKPVAQAAGAVICPVYGGVPMIKQVRDLERGVHIVVGTPGRLNDHLRRKTLVLKDLSVLVLDEADIMLDMGFKEEIDEILKLTPKERKIWLFSATVKSGITDIKNNHMNNVSTVRVSQNTVGTQNTKQFYCISSMGQKLDALCRIIDGDPEFYGFIFCPTKALTGEISERLAASGYNVNCLHGDMDQPLRTRVIQQFRLKKFSILVATDVAARGIDIPDITHVVNYCLPNDQDSYVHRIGRTGRAGKTGIAITFVNNSELRKIRALVSRFNINIQPMNVPSLEDVLKVQMKKVKEYLAAMAEKSSEYEKYSKELVSILKEFSGDQVNNILLNLLSNKFFKKFELRQNAAPQASSDRFSSRERSGDRDSRGSSRDRDRDSRESGRDRGDSRDRGDRGEQVFDTKSMLRRENKVELEINLGSIDGITSDDIKIYLQDNGKVQQNDMSRIKVLKKKTFVILPADKVTNLVGLLENTRLHGKRARVALNA